MSVKPTSHCMLCGKVLGNGPEVMTVILHFKGVPRRTLCWCVDPCATDDELHMELADILSRPDGGNGDSAYAVYNKILDTLPERHGTKARRVLESVRK